MSASNITTLVISSQSSGLTLTPKNQCCLTIDPTQTNSFVVYDHSIHYNVPLKSISLVYGPSHPHILVVQSCVLKGIRNTTGIASSSIWLIRYVETAWLDVNIEGHYRKKRAQTLSKDIGDLLSKYLQQPTTTPIQKSTGCFLLCFSPKNSKTKIECHIYENLFKRASVKTKSCLHAPMEEDWFFSIRLVDNFCSTAMSTKCGHWLFHLTWVVIFCHRTVPNSPLHCITREHVLKYFSRVKYLYSSWWTKIFEDWLTNWLLGLVLVMIHYMIQITLTTHTHYTPVF